jgi:hypothetical protein
MLTPVLNWSARVLNQDQMVKRFMLIVKIERNLWKRLAQLGMS